MFKTDKKSLEEISFIFDESDISRFKRLLDIIKGKSLNTLGDDEIERLSKGLLEIGRLKLEGKVYGFHVDDSYAAKQGGDAGEGVELSLRQGDKLKEYVSCSDRDYVLKVDDILKKIRDDKLGITRIYTGHIPTEGFLGIPQESDSDDPLIRGKLQPYEISDFQEAGIEVVVLESLI